MVSLNRRGFTIVELLISTTILTVVLAGASFIVVQVGRMYYKGVIQTRTQEAARNIVDQISRPIQLENKTPSGLINTNPPQPPVAVAGDVSYPVNVLCIGSVRYSYVVGMQADSKDSASDNDKASRVLWRDTNPDSTTCLPNQNMTDLAINDGESLLPDNMRINELYVNPLSVTNKDQWVIKVNITYGDIDLIDPATKQCKSAVAGSQFCAQASYETVVTKRVRSN